ncbi:hypothetical protein MCOR29_004657 [Pyricularia oryzae]|uniref:DPH-type MB domain-containing protein n=1 Tax=Pyricularia grisea TaxID=148305 RepID=A0ABQ8NPN6_PYRGI|nr:hypothetical protein MCOR19_002770 [Pyricularia oryzae]KAI6298959.1 hypothetical protein MCOR33_005014 [Pyricularia grisea]KAI6277463.1 hypothetical protein MCOR26_005111 [Pyricularia oryzae]KAI6279709.1 hypothetical protein MCOR34_011210 [Pyricularia oryzae]KAI6322628.1 hypothetical protein MCOR29_004657 [Pyricularia oryzae]
MADEEEISVYDEVEIEDMTETDIAVCPSCSLMIRVIYEVENLHKTDLDPEPEKEKEETPAQVAVAA